MALEVPAKAAPGKTPSIVLTGNPNCGKTTLFNALTGLRAKVGNYAGVTVERKEGRLLATDEPIKVLDLPGTYSLSPQSLDERISRDVLFGRLPDVPLPDLVVVVVDSSNLERNLYFATQVLELGFRTIIALNMIDVARDQGLEIDAKELSRKLHVPVVPLVASRGEGLDELRRVMLEQLKTSRNGTLPSEWFAALPAPIAAEARKLEELFQASRVSPSAEALLVLSDERTLEESSQYYAPEIAAKILEARARLEKAGLDWRGAAIEGRYERISGIHQSVTTVSAPDAEHVSDRLDRILTHRVWGLLIFIGIMAVMFQSIFTLAQFPMDALEAGVAWIGDQVGNMMPPGDLRSLLVDGVIAGVGAVVVFLPQICLLFMFIGLLEDTGYMARAAFLMDRLMSKVGLHGKSFIPMLSSFACAIPGIMATRTIESPKDRLATILVAPLMSCSARLPVYTLLIAACIPDLKVWGFFKLTGLTMLGMYLLGIVMALLMAWIFKRTLLRGEPPLLIMELPPYKRPVLKVVLRHMWDRSRLFLRRAGTVILGISILLWFMASYPRTSSRLRELEQRQRAVEIAAATSTPAGRTPASDAFQKTQLAEIEKEIAGEKLRSSFAGKAGRLLEPIVRPLGFDWKIGIGLIASFAAREVFVSTMSTVYNVGDGGDSDEATGNLATVLKEQRRPDGSALYTPLLGVTLMVFYVFALQCVSTVAVVRRETNSWKWPLFQWAYMGALAWALAFATWQGGHLLGFR